MSSPQWECPHCMWRGTATTPTYGAAMLRDHEAYACPMTAQTDEEVALRIGRRNDMLDAYPTRVPRVVARRGENGRLAAVIQSGDDVGEDLSRVVFDAEVRRLKARGR